MQEIYKYGDLSTKIRVMKGRMLKVEDYKAMLLKRSVKEVALYLKNNTYYKKDLIELDENHVHRTRLEVLLYRSVVRDALKIAKHLNGNEKKIYRYIYRKLEVEDIKQMIRTLQMGRALSTLDRATLFVSRYSNIDFNQSLEATSITELVKTLSNSNFYRILHPLIDKDGNIDNFTAEMVLDDYYYQKSIKQIRKMALGKDKELLEEMFGLEIDFKNIFWILRAKKYYKLSREMIHRYIIPYHYKLRKELIDKMIDATDLDRLYKLIDSTYYAKVIDFRQDQLEYQFLNHMHKIQQRQMRNEAYSIAPIIGYMYLKELEVQNITNIVEGIRYGLDNASIQSYLAGAK
jgi:V/A-type H+-transporting ATPase subunit C